MSLFYVKGAETCLKHSNISVQYKREWGLGREIKKKFNERLPQSEVVEKIKKKIKW